MTKEEKDLLLRYLCTRLPYGVICEYTSIQPGYELYNEIGVLESIQKDYQSYKFVIDGHLCGFSDFKPYLRPMSSMTEKEREELHKEQIKDEQLFTDCIFNHPEMRGLIIPHFAEDWCNKNMFDYGGLISKGLALEAPERMYKIN